MSVPQNKAGCVGLGRSTICSLQALRPPQQRKQASPEVLTLGELASRGASASHKGYRPPLLFRRCRQLQPPLAYLTCAAGLPRLPDEPHPRELREDEVTAASGEGETQAWLSLPLPRPLPARCVQYLLCSC